MKKRNIKYYVIDLLMAAMLITSVFGMAHITLDEAMATDGTTSGNTITFKEIVTPSPVNASCDDSESEVRARLPQKVSIKVYETVSGNTQEVTWTDAATVTWSGIQGYDVSRTTAYTCTCAGTVQGDVTYNGKTVNIPTPQTINATINMAASVDYKSSSLDEEGFKATIKSEDIEAILNAQTGELKRLIDQARLNGESLSIKINVDEIDEDDADDDGKIEKRAKKDHDDAKIGKYFKITVHLVVGRRTINSPLITDTGDTKIKFTYTIPDGMKSSSSSSSKGTRKYRAFYYHDGDGHGLGDWTSGSPLSFKSSDFSPYGIAYYDESSSSSSRSSSGSVSTSTPGSQTPSTGGGAPKTGDNFNPRIWIYLLIVCATVASAAWILLQDTKDDKEKEDNN
ncbi:MAG: hypothetical protein K6E90_01510 [Lachnospiraceae bacterium]|nr:hypothetical protein [Lachnospiraceae bacterium]